MRFRKNIGSATRRRTPFGPDHAGPQVLDLLTGAGRCCTSFQMKISEFGCSFHRHIQSECSCRLPRAVNGRLSGSHNPCRLCMCFTELTLQQDFQRQPSAGATVVRIASITCTLYATPNWFGTVSKRVSASAIASSFRSCSMRTSGSAA